VGGRRFSEAESVPRLPSCRRRRRSIVGVPAGLAVSEWVRACLIFCAFFILAGTFFLLSLN